MNYIDKYFFDKLDKLSYIEIKNNEEKYIDYGLNDISIPIVTDELMKGLQNDHFENEVSLDYMVEGMLYNIAFDEEFIYIKDYKNVLKNIIKNPSNYAISLAADVLDKDLDKSLILFRAAYLLDKENKLAAYNYARLLWRLDEDNNFKQEALLNSIEILEKTINLDPEFALGYYELANIYRSLNQFIKSKNYYQQALNKLQIEDLKEEVRQKMKEIEPDALVEDAVYYINKMNYSRALELLQEANKIISRYDVIYYMAVCYLNSDQLDLADEYFEKSLKSGADFATLYIDYIYVKYLKNQIVNALHLANEAIEKYPSDIKLRYNRALILSQVNKDEKAIEDLNFILEYADLSDEMFNEVMIAKESILNKGL